MYTESAVFYYIHYLSTQLANLAKFFTDFLKVHSII